VGFVRESVFKPIALYSQRPVAFVPGLARVVRLCEDNKSRNNHNNTKRAGARAAHTLHLKDAPDDNECASHFQKRTLLIRAHARRLCYQLSRLYNMRSAGGYQKN